MMWSPSLLPAKDPQLPSVHRRVFVSAQSDGPIVGWRLLHRVPDIRCLFDEVPTEALRMGAVLAFCVFVSAYSFRITISESNRPMGRYASKRRYEFMECKLGSGEVNSDFCKTEFD